MKRTQNDRVLLGEASEHLVLSRLLIRGHTAMQGPRGIAADDIYLETGCRIQVKGNRAGSKAGWFVDQREARDECFYALVDFSDESAPVVYLLPSDVVQRAIAAAHDAYVRRNPNSKDSGIRKVRDPWNGPPPPSFKNDWLEAYREAWSQLDAFVV